MAGGLESYLHELYERLPVGVFAVSPDGRMLLANQGFRQLTGTDDVEGWLAGLDPDAQRLSRAAWEACRTRGEPCLHDLATHDRNGQPVWLRWRAIRLADGTIAGTLSDTTEIERARSEAAAASRAKTEFLANMSHEIRTPMNSIVGLADLLWESELSPGQRTWLRNLRDAGDHLLALISDLLDLSRIEAGELGMEHHELNLREQLDKAVDLVAERARAKSLEVHCSVAPGVPHYVVGDPLRLRQVLVNLLVNAIKFTERGEIVARVESAAGNRLQFSVRDTGPGIALEDQARIFRPFEQGDASISRRSGGVGLGLSISRKLVERMGGRMWVDSEPGRGATFRFEVELPAAGPAAGQPSLVSVNLRDARVLIADENITGRMILHEMVAGWGAVVEDLADPSRAVERADELDAIVLARNLSDGGDELIQRLRARCPPVQLAIVLIVSELRPGDDERLRARGVQAVLLKPVRRRELFEALNSALSETGSSSERGRRTPASAPATPLPPLHILLADDSEDSRLLVDAFLAGGKHAIDAVDNGRAAVKRAAAHRYDAVLMDLQMPVLDGISAIREIRAAERAAGLAPVPILAMTGHAAPEDVARTLAAGANGHLAKPLRARTLVAALAGLVPAGAGENERVRVEVTPTVAALVPGFLANRAKDVRAAHAALKRRDYHGLWVLAHTMKGLGASYGFDGITDIGQSLEKAALAHDDAGGARAIHDLESYLGRVDYAVAS